MTKMTVAARIGTQYGWLYLGEGTQYRIAAGSFEDQSVSFRRSEVTNPFVEGAFLVNALRENVTESLQVWVEDRPLLSLGDAVDALAAAVSQVSFVMQVQIRRDVYTWNCYAADHSVVTQREFMHARLAKFSAEIPRHPERVREELPVTYQELHDANITNAQLATLLTSYGQLPIDTQLKELTEKVAWTVPVVS